MPAIDHRKQESVNVPLTTMRIAWIPTGGDKQKVLVHFPEPYFMDAVEVDRASVTSSADETLNAIEICFAPDGLAIPEHIEASMENFIRAGKVAWQPGCALIFASVDHGQAHARAVIAFSFYQMQVQKLELAILPFEKSAKEDVRLVYRMSVKNRREWPRLYRTMENLQQLRLQFARLKHRLHEPAAGAAEMSRATEMTFRRLIAKTCLEQRLEILSERLEACEDLYEGAVDRISDFRMYGTGNLLEWVIVFLLLAEVVLLIVFHH